MAKRPLQFGDEKGEMPDLELRLIYADGAEYDENPLLLHSHVLKKSEFFAAMLSEFWSSDVRPLELKVDARQNVNHYLKCIRFMYLSEEGKQCYFTSVEEALGVLEIASKYLVKDCVEACLRYLEAVRWTSEQKRQITGLISALQLKVSPDLAGRLRIPELVRDVEFGKRLGTLISSISTEETARDIPAKLLLANFDADASPGSADAMVSALLGGLRSNLEVIKSEFNDKSNFENPVSRRFPGSRKDLDLNKIRKSCSALLWLVQHLQRLEMLEPAVKLFAEDPHDFIDALSRHLDVYNPFVDTLFEILITLLHALGSGKVISPKSFRLSFITTWCPVIETLHYNYSKHSLRLLSSASALNNLHAKLVGELIGVAETLPLIDRTQIVDIWIKALLKLSAPLSSDLSDAVGLCCSGLLRLLGRKYDTETGVWI